jgi:diacylglycerol kinase family enzyme
VDPVPALVNPTAGSARAVLDALTGDARFHLEEATPATLPEAIAEHVRRGADRVVVAGGDGTLASAAAVLVGRGTALAVLPGGTLNHFAHALAVPADLPGALEVALQGSRTTVDVGYLNDRLFLNTSSVGVYVLFVRLRERLERWLGYYAASAVAAVQAFVRLKSLVVELEVEGETRRYESPLVFVGVGERELRPPKLGDRKSGGRRGLHVLVVRRTTRLGLLRMAVRAAFTGVRFWGGDREVESLVVPWCRVTLRRRRSRAALDGELLVVQGSLRYDYRPDALTVIVPRPA